MVTKYTHFLRFLFFNLAAFSAKGGFMKKILRISVFLISIVLLCVIVSSASTPLQITGVQAYRCVGDTDSAINVITAKGSNYLVIPYFVDLTKLPIKLDYSGDPDSISVSGKAQRVYMDSGEAELNIPLLCGRNSPYVITFSITRGTEKTKYTVEIRQTSEISAIYLTSDDPVEHGREWVESSPDKSNKATGTMLMVSASGEEIYNGELTQIKGRGNSTWAGEKRPYQIKLGTKTDLLCTGDKSNKDKTWILLANYYDPTALHNTIAYDLAGALPMNYSMQTEPVDLYYDGQYRGLYLLCEKVSINPGRVDIHSLEDNNEDCNDGIDLESLPRYEASTANGATFVYCEGMQEPENIEGGYLIEMDMAARALEEACWFRTIRGQYVVVKSPEYASKGEMNYIATLYQRFENALNNGGIDPETGLHYTDLCDLRSTVQCYLLNELTKNTDAWKTSAFLYKDAGSDKLYMGPIWDYDLCFGDGYYAEIGDAELKTGFFTLYDNFSRRLYDRGDFREEVKRQYTEEFYPLLSDVLLGDMDAVSENGWLHSYTWYLQHIEDSSECNSLLWKETQTYLYSLYPGGDTRESNQAFLEDYLQQRSVWLLQEYSSWNKDTAQPLSIYRDVPEKAWYADDVNKAFVLGLLHGTGQNCYSPQMKVARNQAIVSVYALAGSPLPEEDHIFTDTRAETWSKNAISWGVEQGIVSGTGDGSTFSPKKDITRQDLIVMLYRWRGCPESSGQLTGFVDASSVSKYARDAVSWAVEIGLLYGNDANKLNPKGTVVRAELAAFIVRMYNMLH